MDDIYTLLNKIDTQLGTRYKSNYFIDDKKDNDMILNNRNSMYNNNINYSLNKPNDNFIINDNNNLNNNNYYYPNNKSNLSQFDKISKGNKEYFENNNLIYDQRNEMVNSMEKRNKQYSDNIQEELNASLIRMQNDLETLKKKNNNIDRINDDLDEINKKLSKYQLNLKYLENEAKNTENALNAILIDKKKKDESITNIHNELEAKFMDFQKKLNSMKDEQGKTGEQLRISMIDNNYDESISILNNDINKFMVEHQLNSQDLLKNMYDKIEEQNNEKKDKLKEINENTKNLQQEIDIINQNLSPLTDIPQMKVNIQDLNVQINNMTNKIEQISENVQTIKKEDSDNNINMKDIGDKYNEILNEQLKDINFIKQNYTHKDDLKDINDKFSEIENDLKKLNEEDDGNNITIAKENLNNMNKDSNMVSKNEFNEEIKD
jgi:chromosome segregation ATPase